MKPKRKAVKGNPVTFTALKIFMDNEDCGNFYNYLQDGDAIGREIQLSVTDYQNRFYLGKFTAKITGWIPPVPISKGKK